MADKLACMNRLYDFHLAISNIYRQRLIKIAQYDERDTVESTYS